MIVSKKNDRERMNTEPRIEQENLLRIGKDKMSFKRQNETNTEGYQEPRRTTQQFVHLEGKSVEMEAVAQ